jgi:predicted  nucleic acid-binding Zn-ribbon protein
MQRVLKSIPKVPKAAQEDAFRKRLSTAIEAAAAADKKLAAVRAAGEAAFRESVSLSVNLKEAEANILECEKAEVQFRIQKQMGQSPQPGQTVAAAKRKVEDLRHEIATVDRARSELEGAETEARHQLSMHKNSVERARDELLQNSPEVKRVFEDYRVACATLRKYEALMLHRVFPFDTRDQRLPDDVCDFSLRDRWVSIISKLLTDANVPLE